MQECLTQKKIINKDTVDEKKILIILTILTVGFLFLLTRINIENSAYETNYQMLDGKKVKELISEKKQFFIIIISSTCSGSPEYMPKLVSNLSKLKEQKIPFMVIADELYKDNLDEHLNTFKELYNFKEDIYILDKDVYKKNGGLFNNKARYNSFLIDLIGRNHNVPLGYGIYLYFENGVFKKHNNTI